LKLWRRCVTKKESVRLYNQPETPDGSTQSWVLCDSESNHNPWSSLTLRLRMFSHTFSDLHTDTTDTHAKSADVITEPRTHIFIHKLTSEYKSLHSSVFIRNQTTTQPNCWRNKKFQQPSQVVLQNRHPDLSIYASLSSSTTFNTALPLPTLNPRKQNKTPSLALLNL
jgi:hypothetical protein